MPGIACEVEHEPFATSRANLRFLHDAADDTQVFVCPVARDDTTGELGRIIDELTHYVVLPGDPVCTIHAVPADGTMIELMRSTALSRGLTALHDELPGFVARDRERYVLECHLGPNGRIIGGRWRED